MKKSNLNAMVAHSMRCFPAALTVSVLLAAFAPFVLGADELKFANLEESRAEYDRSVKTLLAKKCGDCHQEDKAEGQLDLLTLDPDLKQSSSAARWAMVVEKVTAREMPPKEGTPLTDAEFKALTNWIAAEMKRSGKHLARREAYNNGNKIPHHMLFDPQQSAPLDAPPRIRTVSPEIYSTYLRDLTKGTESLVGQPFSPGGKSTFKDMYLPKVDEPVTAQILSNALALVERQTGFTREGKVLKPRLGAQKDFLPFVDETAPLGDAEIERAINMQFARVLEREPTSEELQRYAAFMKKNVAEAGRVAGVRYSLAAVFLLPEGIFRYELGTGPVDDKGRVRLSPQEIATVISLGLTDDRPTSWLITMANKGELDTQEGVGLAVRRLLEDPKLAKPRILRFFREYFGYENAADVFKETKDMPGHDPRALIEDTDRLIIYILEQDKQVLRELLTTNKAFVMYKGAAESKQKRAEALAKFEEDKKKNPEKFKDKKPNLPGRAVYESYNLADFPDEQPVELPKEQRAGILTQPSWLIAWSTADDNHAILRGKWVRERLLGGVVPDIPITVDAQLPDAPHQTLRERMLVTTSNIATSAIST
jgi:mono/diheme cytochrome c family protein